MSKEEKLYFVFYNGELLLERFCDNSFAIPRWQEIPFSLDIVSSMLDLSPFGTMPVKALLIQSPPNLGNNYVLIGLRESFDCLPQELYLLAGKCRELLFWDTNTRYCGVCGGPMYRLGVSSKRCTCCGKEVWPSPSTAVITLVYRENEVLLVRAHNFHGTYFGLVAGFVEMGETLEQALKREVYEETGLKVCSLRYFDSQPWPYPCSLMVGFFSQYKSGELRLQHEELATAGWFTRHNLPNIPGRVSLARRMIEHWLEESK